MKHKTQLGIAYCTVMVCLLIGVICYAGYSKESPDEPIRLRFKSTAGHVLFSHQNHTSGDGYGLDCDACHHDDYDDPQSCSECHNGEDSDLLRMDAFHTNCKGCHEEDSGPVDCSGCHTRY